MADLIYADLVEEVTTTAGTGAITPGGAVDGSRSFAAVLSEGDQFYYSIDGAPADTSVFEIGIGTFASGTIERAPIVSSDGTSAVDLPAGTKRIALTVAAQFYQTVQAHDVFAAWQALPGNESASVSDFLAAMANRNGLVLDPPTVVDNAYSQILIDQPPPSGLLNSNDGDDGVNLRLLQNSGRANQGPTSEPEYYDTVFALGFNMTTSYTPLNTAMPSGSYRIESKFAQGAPTDPFMSEYHVASHFAVDWATAGEFRAITATVPHNSADWDSVHCAVGQRGALHIQWDWDLNPRITADFRTAAGGVIDYQDGGSGQGHPKLRFNTNNKPAFEQVNAAGTSYLPLPYRNQYDNIQFDNGAVYVATPTQTNPSGSPTCFSIICTGGSNNQSAMNISCPAITGNFFAQTIGGSASAGLIQQVYNTGAGASTLDLQVLNGAGNDAIVGFSNVGGGTAFTIGYDNSDGDKLKIEKSYRSVGSGANLFVEFDPAIDVTYFAKPPKLPSHAVAGLPDATVVGAGAMAFCTDESGGAVPVFSDGSDWRRVTDRAVAS